MSTQLAPDSHCSPCTPLRSRSPSTTRSATPESHTSDSPSSDPDIFISFANSVITKSLSSMEVDVSSNLHVVDMEADVPFDVDFELRQLGMHSLEEANAFPGQGFDDIVLGGRPNMSTNTKVDVLMLEDIIKDGAFEPSSAVGQFYQPYPPRPPGFRDFTPSPPALLHESNGQSQTQPDLIWVNPSSTQQPSPQLYCPPISQASSTTPSSFKIEPQGVLLLSPASQSSGDACYNPYSHSSLHYDHTLSAVLSSDIVCPPKDACLDLPIFFPSIPREGTKSRVETQIKLAFELGYPILSSSHPTGRGGATSPSSSPSNSSSASPIPHKTEVPWPKGSISTHDKVGTYGFIRLPRGTTTKRRIGTAGSAMTIGRRTDLEMEDILKLTADVMCCSAPHVLVQSCPSCKSREAKRTARKVAARVRPSQNLNYKAKPKKPGKKGMVQNSDPAEHPELESEEVEFEPNADASIIQFNCSEIVDFGGGSVVLPMRITCYCRHHKEKVGFNIVFTLRDHLGRVVGRGTTPPILITDDHKSNNAVSRLPPMHPLRQALNPPLLPHAIISAVHHSEEPNSTSPRPTQDQGTGRVPTKRREEYPTNKKHRPKPYDGRPITRATGVSPGIGSRQGVVLALHPAHVRMETPVSQESTHELFDESSRVTTTSPGAETPISPSQHSGLLPSPSNPEKSLPSPSPSLSGLFAPKIEPNVSTVDFEAGFSRHTSPPISLALSLPTTPPSPSSHLPSPDSSKVARDSMQSLPDRQAPSHKSLFPLYPSTPHDSVPKIRRLIPSSGPTTGGIEITVLGSDFHESLPLECIFGGAIASSTHRWSDNTLVCVLPPRATPGIVGVGFKGIKENGTLIEDGACLFNYVDESDRQLMELALQVVGLKMTGKIEEAREVALRIVGSSKNSIPGTPAGDISHIHSLSGSSMHFAYNSLVGSLGGMDLETLIIKLLTLLDVPSEAGATTLLESNAIGHRNATGQTLLHLAVILALPALVSCLIQRSIDLNVRNTNGLTALHFAALTGWKEGAQMLLAAGADVSAVDLMGLTATDRARRARSQELANILEEAGEKYNVSESESGEEGDDEGWHGGKEVSDGEDSDVDAVASLPISPPQYTAHSRVDPVSHTRPFSEERQPELRKPPHAFVSDHPETRPSDVPAIQTTADDKHALDEKQAASFVGRLQRTFPQGILPNMQIPGLPQLQIPGLPQLQLPDMLAAPWGALPQISVFPVFVPIPNLPHLPNWPIFPWMEALSKEKKEPCPDDDNPDKHPPFALLWTAYDNIANNAWRVQWEKWTAQVAALQDATSPTELPPVYTPREKIQESQVELHSVVAPIPDSSNVNNDDTRVESTSLPVGKATRRMRYGAVKISDTEVDSYHYRPKKQFNRKKDRMLVLFWIPILFIGLAYALYTTVPVMIAGVSKATRKLIPQFQRDDPNI